LKDLLTDELKSQLVGRRNDLVEAGFPESLATRIAGLRYLHSSLDIVDEARNQELPVEQVGKIYFALLEQLSLKWLRNQVETLPVERQWHAHARGNLRDELFNYHRQLAERVLSEAGDQADPVKAWFQRYQAEVSRVSVMLEEMRNTGAADYPSMQVAIKGLGQLLNATS